MITQLINDEKFTNIQKAQAGLTRLFEDAHENGSFYRVMKNDTPLGVLIPNAMWESIVEDIEALSSHVYKKKIASSRSCTTRHTLEDVKKDLGL